MRKKQAVPVLYIGTKPEAVRAMRDAMLSILRTKAAPAAQIEAVRAIGKMGEIGPVSITNCTFLSK